MPRDRSYDQQGASRRDALVKRLFDSFLGSLDLFSVYLGRRLGYYRALDERGPLTAEALAAATATNERYAREWLEHQAVTGLLEATGEGAERRFSLPAGHEEPLLDEESLAYMTWTAQLMAAFVRPLDRIVEAYRTGGGVAWSEYGEDMVDGQAGQTRPMFANLLASDWLAKVPGLDEKLRAHPSPRIAEVCCGAGWAAIALARAYPNARVDGLDLDGPSIEKARGNTAAAGLADRVTFLAGDAEKQATQAGYHLVTVFEAIHDLPRPVEVLRTMKTLLAPDGVAIVADERVAERFTAPGDDVERVMYGFSILHCLPAGMSDPPSAGTGTVMRPDTLRRYAVEAGFRSVEVLPIANDFWRFYRLVP